MKKFSLRSTLSVVILIFSVLEVAAQDVLWASKVIDVSSEYSGNEFSATRVLGKPDAMWLGNKKSNMWRPRKAKRKSFIMVSFDQPIKVNQVIIAEGEGPGAIKEILGYDKDYYEYVLLELEPMDKRVDSQILHKIIEKTTFEIYAIRIVIDGSKVKGYSGIDAIGVSNDDEPITVDINARAEGLEHPNFAIDRVGNQINSEYVEFNPILSKNGKFLYFSRQYDPRNIGGEDDPEDIWFVEWDEESNDWKEAKNIGAPWNNSGPNFIASISEENNEEVFVLGNRYGEKGKMLTGVSRATRAQGSFSIPVPIEIENDYNYSNHVDYFLVPGGDILLISADRNDSFGERDLYVSFKREDGESFGEPIHLGADINTFGEEESPFMTSDTKTLYFSSNGYKGYGGGDIYRTRRLDDSWKKWSEPINLGSSINGLGHEGYLSVSEMDEHFFYSRSDESKSVDIYDVELLPNLVTVTGRVMNRSSGLAISEADVLFTNSDKSSIHTRTNEMGEFRTEVPNLTKWEVSSSRNQFTLVEAIEIEMREEDLFEIGDLLLDIDSTYDESKNLTNIGQGFENTDSTAMVNTNDRLSEIKTADLFDMLDKMKEGDTVRMHNFHFDLNSFYLRPGLDSELRELASYLVEHVDIKIELNGHADSRYFRKYNQVLSEKRVKSISDQLINFGVDSERIITKGYGESRLVNNCGDNVECEDVDHQLNRRVEVFFLK